MKYSEAVILCGGAGTRLATVLPGRQKTLAEVRGVPVLRMVVEFLFAQEFRRIVLAAGFYGNQVREYARTIPLSGDCEIIVSEEPEPLGTGGAIRRALLHVHSPYFLAINGDCFFRAIDFSAALERHLVTGAAVTLVAVKPRAEKDYGVVTITSDGRAFFREKEGVGDFMSAGAYWISRDAIAAVAEEKFSIEKDFFPALAATGRLYGFPCAGEVHDIGTPERYLRANGDTPFI